MVTSDRGLGAGECWLATEDREQRNGGKWLTAGRITLHVSVTCTVGPWRDMDEWSKHGAVVHCWCAFLVIRALCRSWLNAVHRTLYDYMYIQENYADISAGHQHFEHWNLNRYPNSQQVFAYDLNCAKNPVIVSNFLYLLWENVELIIFVAFWPISAFTHWLLSRALRGGGDKFSIAPSKIF